MKLISEEIQNAEYLVEETNGKKSYKIKGVFLQSDIKNRNGRIYENDILTKEVDRYSKEFIDGYRTSFTLFGSRTKGRPMSYTYDGLSVGDTEFRSRRHLIYVPTTDDPNVTYGDDFDLAAFNQFIDDKGFTRGQIVDRNSDNASWHTRIDFRIDQQLPSFFDGHKAKAYLVIKNLGNMLNDDWGVKKVGNFVGQNIVDARINSDGTYTYNEFLPDNAEQTTFLTQSLWEIRLGVKYNF